MFERLLILPTGLSRALSGERWRRFLSAPVIFFSIFLLAIIIITDFDAFDIFTLWVKKNDIWYLDEVVAMLVLCILPYVTYQSYRLFQLNQALRFNEETILGLNRQNELILNAAADGIFGLDKTGGIAFINPAAARMIGKPRAQMMNQNYLDVLYSSGQWGDRRAATAIHATLQDGISRSATDESFWRQDGSTIPVEYACTPINQNGELIGTVVTFRDITERKRKEAELNRLAAAVRQAAEMIVITDPLGLILYVNPAFELISGYSRQEALGRQVSMLKSDQQTDEFYENMGRAIARGKICKDRFLTRRKDGNLIHVDVVVSPIRAQNGDIVNYVAVSRDVTREVELGRQIRKLQRLEAVGTLAGGIAHDFNNILTAILSYTELTMDDLTEDSLEYNNLQEVIIAANRARDLVKQLLTFSRRGERERVPLFLRSVVDEALKLLQAILPANVRIQTHFTEDEIQVLADPSRIHQVVMNLCTNAAEAMHDGGGGLEIHLEKVQITTVSSAENAVLSSLTLGAYMVLIVKDFGCGIPGNKLDRIFEPFFSTKEVGSGSGLGLSVVHGIVQNHDGIVIVNSEVGVGTTFKVFLPGSDGGMGKFSCAE